MTKPKIKLTPLEKTAVEALTQKEWDTLMQVYECGGWKWYNKSLPTTLNKWELDKEETCVIAEDEFGYRDRNSFLEMGCKVISPNNFYDKQKITRDKLNEIKNYFGKIK